MMDRSNGFEGIGSLLNQYARNPIAPEAEQVDSVTINNKSRPVSEWLKEFGVPVRSRESSFLGYEIRTEDHRKALESAQNMANEICTGSRKDVRPRLFCGLPGTGKTHLACAVVSMILRSGKVSRYLTASDIARSVRSSYSRDSETTEEIILGKLVAVPLLVIDEIGLGIGTEHEKAMVLDSISKRYEAMVPTILISNLSQQAIFDYLGERIIDRLREDFAQIVEFKWKSERGEILREKMGGAK
jgi:DNA replication protein DnaC